jgi:hypothetical protein
MSKEGRVRDFIIPIIATEKSLLLLPEGLLAAAGSIPGTAGSDPGTGCFSTNFLSLYGRGSR